MRHNAARDTLYADAVESSVRAEREKAGLLPPRPSDETVKTDKPVRGKTPADVWLAAWRGGPPAAVDFAVTSGLRADILSIAASDPASVFGSYEDYKRHHLDTEKKCEEQGLKFLPFVIEVHGGGLGPVARRVLGELARAGAAREWEEVEVQASSLLRRMSISVHRENARAILRRLPGLASLRTGLAPDAWAEEAVIWQ